MRKTTTWPCRGGNNALALGVAGVVLALLAVSCATSTPTPYGPVPPVVTSTLLRPTVEALGVEEYAQAIQAEMAKREAEATLAVFWSQQTIVARDLTSTASARFWGATVTQQAKNDTATATARAESATATARAEATRAMETATARAEFTTATAQVEATRAVQTAQAWDITRTASYSALSMQLTAQAAQAEQARLAAERARLTYPVRAYGPWVLLLTAFGLLVWAGYRMTKAAEARVRAVPRDARGDAPILVLPRPGGGIVVMDPDRSFGPATVVDREVEQPPLAPPEYQAGVVARDQAVDLVSRGLPGQGASRSRRRLPPGFGGGLRRVLVLRRLDQAAASGVLPPPMVQALEADWRKVQEGEVEE